MPSKETVLLVGGTGRTGRCVLEQLLSRGLNVRILVRSVHKLSEGALNSPNLIVVEASLLSLSDAALPRHLHGCDAVISCLGHVLSLAGVFGPPRDLVTRATMRLCRSIEAVQPAKPVKFILLSSVSVNHPGGLDRRRGRFEKAFVSMIRGLLPPAEDNQQAANFLHDRIGMANPFAQWTMIRPDTLLEGAVSQYALHDDLVSSLFSPGNTSMANVAHFMCELVTNPMVWNKWKGRLPVIINTNALDAGA